MAAFDKRFVDIKTDRPLRGLIVLLIVFISLGGSKTLIAQDFEGWHDVVETSAGTFRNANIGTLIIISDLPNTVYLNGVNALTIRDKLIIRGHDEAQYSLKVKTVSGKSTLLDTGMDSTVIQNAMLDRGVELVVHSRSIVIRDSRIADDVLLSGNIVLERNQFLGMVDISSFSDLSVTKSQFMNTLTVKGRSRNGKVLNNTFVNSPSSAIVLRGYSTITISNNIIAFNKSGIVNKQRYLQPDLGYNTFYENRDGDHQGCVAAVGYFNLNPEFIDPRRGDYNLSVNSPCINSGDPDYPLDPDGSRADRGAFYHHLDNADAYFDLVTPWNMSDVELGFVTFGWEYFQDNYTYGLIIQVGNESTAFTTPRTKYSLDLLELDFIDLETEKLTWWVEAIGVEDTIKSRERFELALYPNSIDNDVTEIADNFGLYAAYPNPFNAQTRITYDLPNSANVKLSILDLSCRTVDVLEQGMRTHGQHRLIWDGSGFVSGTYFVRLSAGGVYYNQKLVMIK